MASEFLLGRKKTPLRHTSVGRDLLFANERLDSSTVIGAFEHCTFANLSFKGARLEQSKFVDCVFLSCYFRLTAFVNSSFSGCRFIDCDFPKATVQTTTFNYTKFVRCFISYSEMRHSLPSEPNIREDLATSLAQGAEDVGGTREARQFRLESIQARQVHLMAGVKNDNHWYVEHFRGLARVRALAQWIGSKANGLIWGHGERAWVLGLNILLLGLVFYPLIYFGVREGFEGNAALLRPADYVYFSLGNLIPGPNFSTIQVSADAIRFIALTEVAAGLIFTGLLIAQVLRWIVRR